MQVVIHHHEQVPQLPLEIIIQILMHCSWKDVYQVITAFQLHSFFQDKPLVRNQLLRKWITKFSHLPGTDWFDYVNRNTVTFGWEGYHPIPLFSFSNSQFKTVVHIPYKRARDVMFKVVKRSCSSQIYVLFLQNGKEEVCLTYDVNTRKEERFKQHSFHGRLLRSDLRETMWRNPVDIDQLDQEKLKKARYLANIMLTVYLFENSQDGYDNSKLVEFIFHFVQQQLDISQLLDYKYFLYIMNSGK